MSENFSYHSDELKGSLVSSEEDSFTFTDLLFEIAETVDFVLIPQPRSSLEAVNDQMDHKNGLE